MNALLTRLFGKRKLTSTSIEIEIAAQEAALADARARVDAALRDRRAAMDSRDKIAMAATDALKLDAEQDVELAEHAIGELRQALDARLAVEAVEVEDARLRALDARTEAARRLVAKEAVTVLDRYDAAAAEVVQAVEALAGIDAEVAAVNAERRAAGLEPIADATTTHRTSPSREIAERREKQAKWFRRNRATGEEEEVGVFGVDERGERFPSDGSGRRLADAHRREVEVVVERARVARGVILPSLSGNLNLPSARIGLSQRWPKAE